MSLRDSELWYCAYAVACVLATVALGITCITKYNANEDVSQNNFHKFHQDGTDDIYPSVTLCVANPFLEDKLKAYGDGINIRSYSDFLHGITWDERMLEVDYDNVTVSIEDHLNAIYVEFYDQSNTFLYNHITGTKNPQGWQPKFDVNFAYASHKCFTFNVPFVENRPVLYFMVRVGKGVPHPSTQTFGGRSEGTA